MVMRLSLHFGHSAAFWICQSTTVFCGSFIPLLRSPLAPPLLPQLIATAAGLPAHHYPQEQLTEQLQALWASTGVNAERVASLHAGTTIETRYTAEPLERYLEMAGWASLNEAFLRRAVELGERALVDLLDQVPLDFADIAHLAVFSTTGIAVPSLDARLMNRLPFARTLKRLPVYGLGCAAGAAGIARISDYLAGHPKEAAIALTVELCSLTIEPGDLSAANLIACGLFGDAAAAVLLVGDAHPLAGTNASAGRPLALGSHSGDGAAPVQTEHPEGAPAVQIVGTRSTLFSDTERVMGWDVMDAGMRIVLSAVVPEMARTQLRAPVEALLAEHGLSIPDIGRWLCHPGGPRVVDAIEDGLELGRGRLDDTRSLLRRVGNCSSSSVLLLLDEAMRTAAEPAGTWGVLLAMGPGFSAEIVLLRW